MSLGWNRYALALSAAGMQLLAQSGAAPTSANDALRQAAQSDAGGRGQEARALYEEAIETAATPSAKANAQRNLAMSWAFEGNCQKTAEYEEIVIAYWKTQEAEAPQNAFYQQGEMANEAARVCLDNDQFAAARQLYRRGHGLGLREPGIPAGRKALWDFRWEDAQARLGARRKGGGGRDAHRCRTGGACANERGRPETVRIAIGVSAVPNRLRRAVCRRCQQSRGGLTGSESERRLCSMFNRHGF